MAEHDLLPREGHVSQSWWEQRWHRPKHFWGPGGSRQGWDEDRWDWRSRKLIKEHRKTQPSPFTSHCTLFHFLTLFETPHPNLHWPLCPYLHSLKHYRLLPHTGVQNPLKPLSFQDHQISCFGKSRFCYGKENLLWAQPWSRKFDIAYPVGRLEQCSVEVSSSLIWYSQSLQHFCIFSIAVPTWNTIRVP